MTWLGRAVDSLVQDFSPVWAAERTAARMAMQGAHKLGFRDADRTRVDKTAGTQGRADYELELTQDRREMVDRARQLERSSALANGILTCCVENVAGTGYQIHPETEDPAWNTLAEKLWYDWCETADVRGLSTFDELMALYFRSYMRDGDVGLILLDDGTVQTFESDQLSSPTGALATKTAVDGINLDRRGKPTSYWIVNDPDPTWATVRYQQHVEVPAESVVFSARRLRLGQTRGISGFQGSCWLFDQIDGYIESVTIAARMAAMFGVLLTSEQRMSGLTTTTSTSDGNARRKLVLEPGMFKELHPGENVTQVKAEQPTTQFETFLKSLLRISGMAFGLPVELFYDFTDANFSNQKAAQLRAQRAWTCLQTVLDRAYSATYRWHTMRQIASGRLASRADAFSHSWIKPGWKWLDPKTEIMAAIAAIDAGFDTPSAVVSRQGGDFESLLLQRAKDFEALAESLPPIRGTMTRDPLSATAEGQGQEGDEDQDQDQDEEQPAP